jgi:hypothetical protein
LYALIEIILAFHTGVWRADVPVEKVRRKLSSRLHGTVQPHPVAAEESINVQFGVVFR